MVSLDGKGLWAYLDWVKGPTAPWDLGLGSDPSLGEARKETTSEGSQRQRFPVSSTELAGQIPRSIVE